MSVRTLHASEMKFSASANCNMPFFVAYKQLLLLFDYLSAHAKHVAMRHLYPILKLSPCLPQLAGKGQRNAACMTFTGMGGKSHPATIVFVLLPRSQHDKYARNETRRKKERIEELAIAKKRSICRGD